MSGRTTGLVDGSSVHPLACGGQAMSPVDQSAQERAEEQRAELALLERERTFALAMLADEIAHALATPVAYFRALFAQDAPATLVCEDVEAGREEVAKLELLL